MVIDVLSLRNDLIKFFGLAKSNNDATTIDLIQIKNADLYGLVSIAEAAGFDIENYVIEYGED